MSTSTIEARRAPAKRLGVFLLGVAVACAGAFSLSTSQADAAGFEMQFDKGAINLGAAFKGQQILPAPKTVNGTKAAYWWDGADTGFATTAAETWYDTIVGSPIGAAFDTTAREYLQLPQSTINTCTTQYAAFPEKGDNVATTAEPNSLFPCISNPTGGTIGATDSGYAGYSPCLDSDGDISVAPCFEAVDGVKTVRGWPGAINELVNNVLADPSSPFQASIAIPLQTATAAAGAVVPKSIWGNTSDYAPGAAFDPNSIGNPAGGVQGDIPMGFLDQVIPVSDTSAVSTFDPEKDTTITEIKIGANAFRFPLMVVPSPVDGSPVPITLAVTGAPFTPDTAEGKSESELYVTGEYNPNTGSLSLKGALEARVLVGLGIQATPPSPAYPLDPPADQKGGPTPFVYCATPLEGLTLSTTGSSTESGGFPGTPYFDGIEGEGAIAGTFNITKDSVPTVLEPWATAGKNPNAYTGAQAPNCATVNTVTKGAGAIWLGNGEDIDVPVCAEDEVGNYPDCAKAETNFAKPTLKVKKSVKAGKKLAVTVKVKNNGNIEGTANVRVQTSNGKVKAPTLAVKVNVDPGKTGSKTVKLATRKGSKGKVTVYATTNDKTGKATTKVKK